MVTNSVRKKEVYKYSSNIHMNMYKENQTTVPDKNSAGKYTNEQKCQHYT